jgi:hypothetical protein
MKTRYQRRWSPAREIRDRPVGVIGPQDHLDDVPDRALQQYDEIDRWCARHGDPQLIDDLPRRARPLRTLAVAEKSPRPQPPVDLAAQLHQITARARRRKTHMTLDIRVAVDRLHEHRP